MLIGLTGGTNMGERGQVGLGSLSCSYDARRGFATTVPSSATLSCHGSDAKVGALEEHFAYALRCSCRQRVTE